MKPDREKRSAVEYSFEYFESEYDYGAESLA